MNVGEANDVNTLLRWVLHGEYAEHGASVDEARAAAQRLAARAYKRLWAGLSGDQVEQLWGRRRVL